MSALRGMIAAAATPVRQDHSIDMDGLLAHCSHLLGDGGCDAINLLGTTGEATSFSVEQRLDVMGAVAGSGLPLEKFMVGTGAAALDDACQLTAAAKSLGFAGCLLLPPFYYKGVEDGVGRYVSTVIERVGKEGLPLYLYHFPANSGVPYALATVRQLREAFPDTLLGLKDSSGDLDYSGTLARGLPGFAVFPSAEGAMARASELGFAGCISATLNVTGPSMRDWCETGAVDALEKAKKLRSSIARYPLVAAVKEALAISTRTKTWRNIVPPLSGLNDDQANALRVELETISAMALDRH